MAVKHSFTSAIADGVDASLVQPSNWNADHVIDTITGIQDAQTPLTFTRFFQNFVGSYNGYLQANLQNKNGGAASSTDYVVTADTGTDTTQYGDFGINGSGYTGTWGGPLDVYLYADGGASGVGDLVIGTQQANTFLDVNIGGGAASNRVVRFSSTGTLWTAFSTDPSTPAADTIHFYMKKIGGRIMPKWMGPSGVDTPAQPFIGMNHCRSWLPGNGAGNTAALVVGSYGCSFVAAGATFAQTTPATGSLKSRTRLASITATATAGNLCYIKGQQLEVARETGFFFVMRFGLDVTGTANLGFAGLYSSVTAPTATANLVTATTARVGMAIQLPSGNWQLVIASGSAVTATDLGASFPVNTTDLLELVMFSAPGASTISYRVTNLTSAAVSSGDFIMTNAPSLTTYMTPLISLSNNATATGVKFSFKQMYLETDY